MSELKQYKFLNLSKQEIFNRVVLHARKQQCKSIILGVKTAFTSCLYRGPNGTKCFIGALIEDAEYDFSIEGKSVYSLLDAGTFELDFEDPTIIFFRELQRIHDSNDICIWELLFKEFAEKYNLEYPEEIIEIDIGDAPLSNYLASQIEESFSYGEVGGLIKVTGLDTGKVSFYLVRSNESKQSQS